MQLCVSEKSEAARHKLQVLDGFYVLGCDYGMFLQVLLFFIIVLYNNVAGQLY